MKKIKTILTMILAATLVLGAALSFSSCKSEDVSVDTEKLVADLLAAKVAAVDGEPMSANAVSTIYGCADMAESAVAYGSGGASADQIALFTAKDATAAKYIVQKLEDYVSEQVSYYADYNVSELPKLSMKCLEQKGKYVLLVVGDGSKDAKSLFSAAAGEVKYAAGSVS